MLWRELRACLPWLDAEAHAGIHSIRGAPANDDMLLLTQRTKLVLRLPATRVADAQSLHGRQLDLDGYVLQIGASRQRPLLAFATLYSQLVCTGSDDELDFLRRYRRSARADRTWHASSSAANGARCVRSKPRSAATV